MKDYEKALSILERVCAQLEHAARDNRYITITKACKLAGNIHEYSVYRIIDNPEAYQIPEELIDRYNDARAYVFSNMIQRVRDAALICDDDYSCDQDSNIEDISKNSTSSPSLNDNKKRTPLNLGYAKLHADIELKLLSKLLPKTLGEKQSQQAMIDQSTNNTLVIDPKLLSPTQLKALASVKMLTKE